MTVFEFYSGLRRDILEEISGVRDASQIFWNDSRSNSSTKRSLKGIYRSAVKQAGAYGLFIVNRYGYCDSPLHKKRGQDGYVMDKVNGQEIAYRDARFTWQGPITQGKEYCKCPCSEKNLEVEQEVIKDVLFDVTADKKICAGIERVISDIHIAIVNAEDKKPRSGIREHLLRAIININDELLPQTMEEFIEFERRQHSATARNEIKGSE